MEEQKRPNRIRTREDLALWREIIGEENYAASLLWLAQQGEWVWIVQTEAEIDADQKLTDAEREKLRTSLKTEKTGYAIVFRTVFLGRSSQAAPPSH